MSTGGIDGSGAPKRAGATSKTTSNGLSVRKPSEAASFAGAVGLESALKASPDARPEAVARATALVNDPQYPSPQTIQQLAGFLASKLPRGAE